MAIPKDQLEKFIQTILEIQNSKSSVVHNTKDLKNIAVEMGYTESDWQEYLAEFDKNLNAASTFLEHENIHDAILYAQKAVELNPYSIEANAILSEAYEAQFMKSRQKIFKQKAIAQANRCLQLDNSHTESYELISRLKTIKSRQPQKILIAFVAGILVLGVASAMLFVTRNTNPPENFEYENQNHIQVENIIVQAPEIEVYFVKTPETQGLEFDTDVSELKNYDNSYAYKLIGYLRLNGIEIRELKLKIDGTGSTGSTLFSKIIEPVRERQAVYRPGDLIPVYFLEYKNGKTNPDLRKIQVSVYGARTEPAAESYEESPEIKSGWAYSRPANMNFVFRERTRSINNSYKDACYYTLSIEAENTGNTTVGTLKVEIEWYDFAEKMILSKTAYICSSSSPEIKKSQTRIFTGTWAIPVNAEKIKEYRIKISSAK